MKMTPVCRHIEYTVKTVEGRVVRVGCLSVPGVVEQMTDVLALRSLSITRFFYMVAVFFVFRMRFYAAWCGAEAGCISAGLGCYPEKALSKPGGGPTVNYRYSL